MIKASLTSRTFHFGFAARTSRGAMRERKSWFIKLWEGNESMIVGIGECGPLPGLSPEDMQNFEQTLHATIHNINKNSWKLSDFIDANQSLDILWKGLSERLGVSFLHNSPSILFALETALLDLANKGERIVFNNSFVNGQAISINGLIWMGGLDFMLQQVEIKIRDGFTCIKLKIGGMDFEKECDILQYIRRKYFRDGITVRLDANGAFKSDDALYKLKHLARFDIHSIEQPVKKGSPDLADLCRNSTVPIALDEELIGVNGLHDKQQLLNKLKPAYIILKPTLHGGFVGCEEWIRLAEAAGIGWWMTSALESSIGLNAIAQFTARSAIHLSQGLGTGEIYRNDFPSPLEVKKGHLRYNSATSWDLTELNN